MILQIFQQPMKTDPTAFGGRPGILVNGSAGLTGDDADRAIEILND